jgi:peptidoglycan/xylan/chitin deacetylase (PgdA/CDA1 family)
MTVDAGRPVPGRLVSIEMEAELRPPWLEPGRPVRYWSQWEPREDAVEGRVVGWLVTGGRRLPLVIERAPGETELRFDPEEAVTALLHERYLQPLRPLHTYLPVPYQWVPGRIRLALLRLMTRRPAAADPGFPDWPIEPAVEAIRFLALAARRRAAGEPAGPAPSPWPEGKRYAFALSHDVDTAAGLGRVEGIAALEAGLGFTSTWFVVGRGYPLDHPQLDRLREEGHEIGLHGDRHDNRIAYLAEPRIRARLETCRGVVERQRMAGFRSPSLLSSPPLRKVLAETFQYVSDTPDTEKDSLIGPRRGCSTCFPFRRDGLLEIPITLPMEDKLLSAGLDEDAVLRVWRRKLEWVREVGGLAQLVTHAEPHLFDRCARAYREILGEVAVDPAAYCANLGEIARWWKEPEVR